jgi:hypothetical protein
MSKPASGIKWRPIVRRAGKGWFAEAMYDLSKGFRE